MAKSATKLGIVDLSSDLPPVEIFSVEECFYIRPACGSSRPELRCTPSRGIYWPRVILHQVSLTFGQPLGQADFQSDDPPLQTSSGQEQYYIR